MNVISFPEALGLVQCVALVQPFELGGYTVRSLDLKASGPNGMWESPVHGRGATVDIAKKKFMEHLGQHIGLALKLRRGFPQGEIMGVEEVARQYSYGTNVYMPTDIVADEVVKSRELVEAPERKLCSMEVHFFRTQQPYFIQCRVYLE